MQWELGQCFDHRRAIIVNKKRIIISHSNGSTLITIRIVSLRRIVSNYETLCLPVDCQSIYRERSPRGWLNSHNRSHPRLTVEKRRSKSTTSFTNWKQCNCLLRINFQNVFIVFNIWRSLSKNNHDSQCCWWPSSILLCSRFLSSIFFFFLFVIALLLWQFFHIGYFFYRWFNIGEKVNWKLVTECR